MPNTSIRRLENSCMPPKKSAWRFDNAKVFKHSSSESQKINNLNMGVMSENSDVKPVNQLPVYSLIDTFSHTKDDDQSDDAPLDFSLKTGGSPKIKTESVRHLIKPFENCELKENKTVASNPPRQMFIPARMVNGNNSPPSPSNGSPNLLDTSHATSSYKDSDSLDMDCSQESQKSPLCSPTPRVSRINEEIHRSNSPEHPHVSRENSPLGQTSILEVMLRGQQQSDPGSPNNSPQAFRAGMGIFENQIISSPSPPIAINGPVMHPANMLPFAMAPYFGYGYVEHPNPFVQNYMYKPPESNFGDGSAIRKSKKRADPLADSLKGCSVDELRKKLHSLNSDNSLGINCDYAVNLKPSYTSHVDDGRCYSNNASPETVKNAINNCSAGMNKRENNEMHNVVVNHHQISNKSNAVMNHHKGISSAAVDVNLNENNIQNTESHNETTGTSNVANVSSTEDTNDSIPSAIGECPDGRKRKPIPDYKSDPLYKIKRAKNNLAARRSRESRRIKEELIRKTANILEQQNRVILRDLTALKFSFDESQVKYFTLLKEFENIKIQNSVLVERLNQKRCGQCGSALPNVN